jgi:hypothetical protein
MRYLTEISVTPTRCFNLTYIILDSAFLLVLIGLLLWQKKYLTFLFSLSGGILYFLVDFGLFYLASHSRIVYINSAEQGVSGTALVLLWMSLSYGITNFAFIWLCLSHDKNLKEWLCLIIGWWLLAPSLSKIYVSSYNIETYRTTNKYHWIMAVLMAVGYLALIIYNLKAKEKEKKINILWLNLIGISVQFAWEAALLINGIRPLNESSVVTLLIDSFIETNLGMPYFFFIYKSIASKYCEDLSKALI